MENNKLTDTIKEKESELTEAGTSSRLLQQEVAKEAEKYKNMENKYGKLMDTVTAKEIELKEVWTKLTKCEHANEVNEANVTRIRSERDKLRVDRDALNKKYDIAMLKLERIRDSTDKEIAAAKAELGKQTDKEIAATKVELGKQTNDLKSRVVILEHALDEAQATISDLRDLVVTKETTSNCFQNELMEKDVKLNEAKKDLSAMVNNYHKAHALSKTLDQQLQQLKSGKGEKQPVAEAMAIKELEKVKNQVAAQKSLLEETVAEKNDQIKDLRRQITGITIPVCDWFQNTNHIAQSLQRSIAVQLQMQKRSDGFGLSQIRLACFIVFY